jgi:hypothetical protein
MYDYKLHLPIRTLRACPWVQSGHANNYGDQEGFLDINHTTDVFERTLINCTLGHCPGVLFVPHFLLITPHMMKTIIKNLQYNSI